MKTKIFFAALLLALAGTIQAASPFDKSLVLSLNFTDGALFFEDAQIAYGMPPNPNPNGVFSVRVVNEDGSTGYESSFGDPRESFSETFYDNGSIEGQSFFEENTRFQLVVGVSEKTSVIKILDENESTLLTIYYAQIEPLAKAMLCALPNKVCDVGYCGEDEPDCEGKQNVLTQEKQEGSLEENFGVQGTAEEKQETQGKQASGAQETNSNSNYELAVNLIYAVILLLVAYVVASVVLKHVKKK